ncbi:MAG: hypothetical protein VB858_19550, partial [Planctomycetaceae bacterium]
MSHWKTTVILVCVGALIAFSCLLIEVIQSQTVNAVQVGVCAGILMTALAVVLRSPDRTQLETDNRAQQLKLDEESAALREQQEQLNSIRSELEQELTNRAQRIDAREVELDNRLITFQEWLEYPQTETADNEATCTDVTARKSAQELSAEDQQVHDLLEAEASALYEKLKNSFYRHPDGNFDAVKARDDLLDLITRVAKIYRPESDNPLLETSVEQLLRAGSR